nr:ABC transporter ATP-binding protein [Austwickia chelonae]
MYRPPGGPPAAGASTVTWRRLQTPTAAAAVGVLVLSALGASTGTVIAGRLAEQATVPLVTVLAVCVIGGALLDTLGRYLWAGSTDRAEGQLREELLDAALDQPLSELSEQAVGEVLDRVDDDTREIGSLVRLQVWMMLRAVTTTVPMLAVAAFTWWPSLVLFPLFVFVTFLLVRPLLRPIAERKVVEEVAWTDHAAVLEEGITGRDDLRTSLGQAFAVQRLAKLSATVHARFLDVILLERQVTLRASLVLHGLLVAVACSGVGFTWAGQMSVGQLVTLFLVTSTFVGHIARIADQLPDLQAGLGAVIRLRQMLALPPEPVGGLGLPDGALSLEFRKTSFAYAEGSFALRDVELTVSAGQTTALVGRTGSGKSTLAALISRAVDPAPGTVFLGEVDVRDLDLQQLRRAVGVVTQRTEIIAGTLAENITLFADEPRERVEAVVAELGLTEWVDGLDEGLDTPLGPGGSVLSAGEEQLLAFARLLMRDVRVVVLDEATARMDPLTEARVVEASERLLRGRTGVLIAHRLSTIARAESVAVLADGAVVQRGAREMLAEQEGPYRDLLVAASSPPGSQGPRKAATTENRRAQAGGPGAKEGLPSSAIGAIRRRGTPPERPLPTSGPSLARGIANALAIRPAWGVFSVVLFLVFSISGAQGVLTGFAWGHLVENLAQDRLPWPWLVLLVLSVFLGPCALVITVARYPRWWVEVLLRVRMSVFVGQTAQRRLDRVPPGEVVARAMDADRYARYADRWVDFVNGMIIAVLTAFAAGTWLAGLVLLIVMLGAATASSVGRPIAGRSAARASAARARFGRVLVSALESARTVKLAARTPQMRSHLRQIDAGRVEAAVKEHRVQAVLDGVPGVLIQAGAVAAWSGTLWGWWGLATALLVVSAVNGFDWFGRVAGAVVTEAPGTRAWQVATSRMAGGVDLMKLPEGVDLLTGSAPNPLAVERVALDRLTLKDFSAVHEDGTIGVEQVDLEIERGELVLLLGQVGAGKSSLLRALAGLTDHRGDVLWNGVPVDDPEIFLRPGQVAYVSQIPRVLSGTFVENVQLGHARDVRGAVDDARLGPDLDQAGGLHSVVGHRGVRLSGGQVQRLALARALAADAELLLADDISSALDARTEIELWQALRQRSVTVVGATSKRAALAQADRVVVLVDGRVEAVGVWSELASRWNHLAG